MKIAILSDIHGNSYALNEVLRCAQEKNVQRLFLLGDIVGYYYHPGVVLDLLKDWNFTFIKGNHEDILASIISGNIDENAIQTKYGSAHFKAAKELNEDQIDFLIHAPEKFEITIDGLNVLLCHGSPWDHNAYLYPDTSIDILERCNMEGTDFVFVGHSHYPFVHSFSNTTLVNVGSVGQSRKKGGEAQWVILDTENSSVNFISTPYDVKPLLAEIAQIDSNNSYLKDVLIRNI